MKHHTAVGVADEVSQSYRERTHEGYACSGEVMLQKYLSGQEDLKAKVSVATRPLQVSTTNMHSA
eukprot:365241-Chlamydomonas_euryale.AAC.15